MRWSTLQLSNLRCWQASQAQPRLVHQRALPVKKDVVDFLTSPGRDFDDLRLDDAYYRCHPVLCVLACLCRGPHRQD